ANDSLTLEKFQGSAELFEGLDRHQDGALSAADFDCWGDMSRDWWATMSQRPRRPGMNNGRWHLPFAVRSLLNGDFGNTFNGPGVGELAPDFTLKTKDAREQISLSQFRGQKPVALSLGSLSCGISWSRFDALEFFYRRV